MLCDCEVYEICPSCAPDEPTYAKAAAAHGEAARRAACPHNHAELVNGEFKCFDCGEIMQASLELPRRYTIESLNKSAREYIEEARKCWASDDVVDTELQLSLFISWLAKREKEGRG